MLFAAIVPLAANQPEETFRGPSFNKEDKAFVSLLWMIHSDMELCKRNLSQNGSFISAIGHLNDAQSALKKTEIDPQNMELAREIHTRISKIKFYAVVKDKTAAVERLDQLLQVLNYALGGNSSSLPNYGGYGSGNIYNGDNSGNYPVPGTTHENVINGGNIGVIGGSQMMPILPSTGGLLPVH